jgi:hypothetical protein
VQCNLRHGVIECSIIRTDGVFTLRRPADAGELANAGKACVAREGGSGVDEVAGLGRLEQGKVVLCRGGAVVEKAFEGGHVGMACCKWSCDAWADQGDNAEFEGV